MATQNNSTPHSPAQTQAPDAVKAAPAASGADHAAAAAAAPNGTQTVCDTFLINQPSAGKTEEVNIVSGQRYIFAFNDSAVDYKNPETKMVDGNMILVFKDGGKLVINNYHGGAELAKMACADGSALDGIAARLAVVNTVDEDKKEATAHKETAKAEIQDLVQDTSHNAKHLAKIQPAAGDQTALNVANIEPAAGGGGGGAGGRGGYGFNSDYVTTPLGTLTPLGVIGQTELLYNANFPQNGTNFGFGRPDDSPSVGPLKVLTVDETNLNPSTSATDKIDVDFGRDGPGTIAPDGEVHLNGLTSHGVPVTVALVDNVYVGTANGEHIFNLTINADGTYVFNLTGTVDHPNTNDPNDSYLIDFGFIATDNDGDSIHGTVAVNILDDGPVAHSDVNAFDTDLSLHTDGNVITGLNGGANAADTLSKDDVNHVTAIAFNGNSVVVPATGTVSIDGAYGTLNISSDGSYTYTLFHKVSDTHDVFTYTLTDGDGDSSPANLTIDTVNGQDDVPVFLQSNAAVDETNLHPTTSVSDQVHVNFGTDGSGPITANGDINLNGLTSNGHAVTATLDGNVYTGTANGETIFTLTVQTDGHYTFDLIQPVDHPNTTDPNDVLNISFGVQATDDDGDKGTGLIQIQIFDDGPVAHNDVNNFDHDVSNIATGNVISGLNGGPGAEDTLSTDGHNHVTSIAFGGNNVAVPTTGEATINGDYGTLHIAADGSYTYVSNGMDGTSVEKYFTGAFNVDLDESQALDANEQQSIGVAPGNLSISGGSHVDVSFVSEGAAYNNSLGAFSIAADGTLHSGSLLYQNVNTLTAGAGANYTANSTASELGFFMIAGGFDENNSYANLNTATGHIDFVYDYGRDDQRTANIHDDGTHVSLVFVGADGAETVLNGCVYYTNTRGDTASLNADGLAHSISGVPGGDDSVLRVGFEDIFGLGDKDYNDFVVDIKVQSPEVCGADVFTYGLTDNDGDTSNATLTLQCFDGHDDHPVFIQEINSVDETNLNPNTAVTGTIQVGFGEDGPGMIAGNGMVDTHGLTSNGHAISVSLMGGSYVGTADGVTVFTLAIQSSGAYVFNLLQPVDHPNANDPNDVVQIDFGVIATDQDSDSANGTIQIKIFDDGPVAHNDVNSFDHDATNHMDGNVITGLNGGANAADVLSHDGNNHVTAISFNGHSVEVPATGTASIDGASGTLLIAADGSYTYTLFHAGTDTSDAFTYNLRDNDGDVSTATLTLTSINGQDDNPVFAAASASVDETNLNPNTSVSDQVHVNFGTDGSGPIVGTGTSTLNGLTSNGHAVSTSYANGVYTGTANGATIFTLTVQTDGHYTFNLLQPVDHPNANDPNDALTISFGVQATDNDGDTGTGAINIKIFDDGPVAHNDVNAVDHDVSNIASGNVITGLNGGANAADILSHDGNNHVTSISFNGNNVAVPTSGTATINGDYGTLHIAADGSYTYDSFGGGNGSGAEKHFQAGPALPDFDEYQAIDMNEQKSLGVAHENLLVQGGSHVDVTFVYEGASLNNSLGAFSVAADGSLQSGNLLYLNCNDLTVGAGAAYTTNPQADQLGFFVISGGFTENNGYSAIDPTHGSIHFVYDYGSNDQRTANIHDDGSHVSLVYVADNGTQTVLKGETFYTTERGDNAGLNPDGQVHVVSGIPGHDDTVLRVAFEDLPDLGDMDYNDFIVDVRVTAPAVCGTDVFTYGLTDNDGDTSKATLTLQCLNDHDDHPIFIQEVCQVDETNLNPTTAVYNHVNVNFGMDGAGSIMASGTSMLNGLTSGGAAVSVALVGNNYVGTANGATVFTLALQSSGDYVFTLMQPVDHPNAANPNDAVTISFGVNATDGDGDTSSGNIVIQILDDGPVAHSDINNVAANNYHVDGNVITGLNGGADAADVLSKDGHNHVTGVSFNGGAVVAIANGSETTINGASGSLNIHSDGSYTYTLTNGATANTHDVFSYTLTDNDGDSSMATLTINSTYTHDDFPIFGCTCNVSVIDETDLNPTTSVAGQVNVNYGADGPGIIGLTGTSSLNGLTSNGHPVTTSFSGNTYTGTANGVTVFTLVVQTDGSYVFNLIQPVDHPVTSDPNDALQISFGVIATDHDGDHTDGTIQIKILDDGPVAHSDLNSVGTNSHQVDGNVITGLNGGANAADILSKDGHNHVTAIAFNGTPVTLADGGAVAVSGQYGTLHITSDGSYTYALNDGVTANTHDVFSYTLTDNDGDSSMATLTINSTYTHDDFPIFGCTCNVSVIDETDLNPTTSVAGQVNVNYGADGPGIIGLTGTSSLNGLTSNGHAVTTSFSGNTYTGTANGVTVFTLVVQTDGSYVFNLIQPVDHPVASDPNDALQISFGVIATDHDGDHTDGTIQIKILDDGPVAHNDVNTLDQHAGNHVEGNVITGLNGGANAADVLSKDGHNHVAFVSISDQVFVVPDGGGVSVSGTYGTLNIHSDGSYNYALYHTGANTTDVFSYTLQDNDGDTSGASLTITSINAHDDTPIFTDCFSTVDETNYNGSVSVNGTISVNYGADAPGQVVGTGVSNTNGLTSNGQPITVSYNNNGVYTGVAAGVTVFTLTIQASGAYAYTQLQPVDHPDHANPNDAVYVSFGVQATDGDGDKGTGTITIQILDDGPTAHHDFNSVGGGLSTYIDGNVITGQNGGANAADILSKDGNNHLTAVSFNGNVVNIAEGSGASLNGTYGTLNIHSDGSYNYTAHGSTSAGNDVFTYTLTDRDGDSSQANLTVHYDAPPYHAPEVHLSVNNGVDDVIVKEDGSVGVPVSADVTGGSGNETVTLTLTGVHADWVVTTPGWSDQGGGSYTLTLPTGQTHYDGQFTFQPPHDSDADMDGLNIHASVYDPDNNGTVTADDGFNIITDAVVDQPTTSVPGFIDIGVNWTIYAPRGNYVAGAYSTPLDLSAHVADRDGSETITKFIIDFNKPLVIDVMALVAAAPGSGADFDTAVVNHITTSLHDMGIYLVGANETAPGVYEVNANNQDAIANLSVITPQSAHSLSSYLSNGGTQITTYGGIIGVTTVVQETNLSGREVDYSDNTTNHEDLVAFSLSNRQPPYPGVSPLIIDLNHNGVELVNQNAGVMFDMNNNHTLDHTSWVGKNDGFLALDSNHDGLINNQSELFGDSDKFHDGFATLGQYDINHDGVISAADDVFSKLVVWQDVNQDGISQQDEMHTLASVGIAQIDLGHAVTNYQIGDSVITHEGTVTYADGHTTQVVDAWFNVSEGATNVAAAAAAGMIGDHAPVQADADVSHIAAPPSYQLATGADVMVGAVPMDVAANEAAHLISAPALGQVLDLGAADPVQAGINAFVVNGADTHAANAVQANGSAMSVTAPDVGTPALHSGFEYASAPSLEDLHRTTTADHIS